MEPELGRIVGYVASDHAGKKVILSSNHLVSPVLQSGPTCGLVSMTMARNLLHGIPDSNLAGSALCSNIECSVGTASLLEYAKEKGLSKQGEMFSVEYMSDIAVNKLHLNARVLDTSNPQEFSAEEVLHLVLCRQEAVLVPYDADRNHSPCLAGGHRAHWCVLVGVCIVLDSFSDLSPELLNHCQPHSPSPSHFTVEPDRLACCLKEIFVLHSLTSLLEENCIYVFARQGKSSHLGLWSFRDLLLSNGNLSEIDPNRNDSANYAIPAGGIKKGLQSKILIVGKWHTV